MRKGTFSVQTANPNSSKHNSRELAPKYLIDSSQKNYYELITPDNEFKNIAQNIYKEKIKQTMQKKQVDNLIQETVLTLQPNQDENDVKELFKELNKKYGGHELLELAIHRDEGYFLKDDIAYYPTKNILLKNDEWYICSDTNIQKPKVTDFDTKVNIDEFEKVYNYHAHAKFSMFDRITGKTARMQKKDMSSRIKFVSETLGLAYAPDKDTRHIKKSVNQIKDEHLAKARVMEQFKEKESKLLKTTFDQLLATKKDLSAAQAEAREKMKELGATREDYAKLEQLNKDLKEQVKENALTIEEMQEKFNALKHSLEDRFNSLHNEKEHYKAVVELKELDIIDLKTQNKSLQEQKEVLVEKVSILEEKINSSPNMERYDYYKNQFEVRNSILEKTNTEFGLEPKGNLRKLVTFFKNTINEMKEKISSLFKRNEELEQENKALKEQIYEFKRDRIIESGKDNPHEAIDNVLKHAGLSNLEKLKEMQERDAIMKKEREKREEEQQRQKQRELQR